MKVINRAENLAMAKQTKTDKSVLTNGESTGPYKTVPRLRECCRQVEAAAGTKFTKPGNGLIVKFCTGAVA